MLRSWKLDETNLLTAEIDRYPLPFKNDQHLNLVMLSAIEIILSNHRDMPYKDLPLVSKDISKEVRSRLYQNVNHIFQNRIDSVLEKIELNGETLPPYINYLKNTLTELKKTDLFTHLNNFEHVDGLIKGISLENPKVDPKIIPKIKSIIYQVFFGCDSTQQLEIDRIKSVWQSTIVDSDELSTIEGCVSHVICGFCALTGLKMAEAPVTDKFLKSRLNKISYYNGSTIATDDILCMTRNLLIRDPIAAIKHLFPHFNLIPKLEGNIKVIAIPLGSDSKKPHIEIRGFDTYTIQTPFPYSEIGKIYLIWTYSMKLLTDEEHSELNIKKEDFTSLGSDRVSSLRRESIHSAPDPLFIERIVIKKIDLHDKVPHKDLLELLKSMHQFNLIIEQKNPEMLLARLNTLYPIKTLELFNADIKQHMIKYLISICYRTNLLSIDNGRINSHAICKKGVLWKEILKDLFEKHLDLRYVWMFKQGQFHTGPIEIVKPLIESVKQALENPPPLKAIFDGLNPGADSDSFMGISEETRNLMMSQDSQQRECIREHFDEIHQKINRILAGAEQIQNTQTISIVDCLLKARVTKNRAAVLLEFAKTHYPINTGDRPSNIFINGERFKTPPQTIPPQEEPIIHFYRHLFEALQIPVIVKEQWLSDLITVLLSPASLPDTAKNYDPYLAIFHYYMGLDSRLIGLIPKLGWHLNLRNMTGKDFKLTANWQTKEYFFNTTPFFFKVSKSLDVIYDKNKKTEEHCASIDLEWIITPKGEQLTNDSQFSIASKISSVKMVPCSNPAFEEIVTCMTADDTQHIAPSLISPRPPVESPRGMSPRTPRASALSSPRTPGDSPRLLFTPSPR